MNITVTKKGQKKIAKKVPLIQAEDLITVPTTKEWLRFVDEQGRFLGKGYLGRQNKGVGWLLTFKDEPIDQLFFKGLFSEARDKRKNFYKDQGTTAFRLVNGEGDHLGGMTIDLYQNYVVISWYNETLYRWKTPIIDAFQEVFPEVLGGIEKIRFSGELPESQQVFGQVPSGPIPIKENGVNYVTYLDDGLMTGIFLDQKDVRRSLVEGLAADKKVLNMFSYTGAFSVAAAAGGAVQTTSVDLAKRSLSKTREQFEVNAFDVQKQEIHVMDVFGYFKYAQKKGKKFDLIILDPPSFARNGKKVFRVGKNYGELVTQSVALLENRGFLVASTNAANLPRGKFQHMIETSLKEEGVAFNQVAEYGLPADFTVDPAFPEGNYLKVFLYQIVK